MTPLYEIDADTMSPAFYPCWKAAGDHLDRQVDGGIRSWLRAHPAPPFLEHLSFRLGNQLFFIQVEDVAGLVVGPGSGRGHRLVARRALGHAAVMPMRRRPDGTWRPAAPGWGLLDADTGQLLDPPALVTDERIDMTGWELQDAGVQVVRDMIAADGFEVLSWQPSETVDPSIFFVGASGQREWVVVRTARYPSAAAARPDNLAALRQQPNLCGEAGHFASVVLLASTQHERPDDAAALPLWRGHPMHVVCAGLEPLG